MFYISNALRCSWTFKNMINAWNILHSTTGIINVDGANVTREFLKRVGEVDERRLQVEVFPVPSICFHYQVICFKQPKTTPINESNLNLIRIFRGVVLVSSKPQHPSSNIKHRDNIFLVRKANAKHLGYRIPVLIQLYCTNPWNGKLIVNDIK